MSGDEGGDFWRRVLRMLLLVVGFEILHHLLQSLSEEERPGNKTVGSSDPQPDYLEELQ